MSIHVKVFLNLKVLSNNFNLKIKAINKTKFIKFILIVSFFCNCNTGLEERIESTPIEKNIADNQILTDRIKYLALGDSYTIGEGVHEKDRWPEQLSEQLKTEWNIDLNLKIVAETGYSCADLNTQLDNTNIENDFDMVSVLIGVNDQFRGYGIEGYRDQFRITVNKAIEYAKGNSSKVFVVSIPDWSFTPFAANHDKTKISKEIDEYNKVGKGISDNLNVVFIDITTVSRIDSEDFSLVVSDGLHPSKKMYQLWVNVIFNEVKKFYE
jgi:lysophospholipase L1-like esterase